MLAIALVASQLLAGPAAAQIPRRVADIRPGADGAFESSSGEPVDLTVPAQLGDRLFFAANDGTHGTELWVTDGTAAGTRMVRDINPGGGGSFPDDEIGTFFTQTIVPLAAEVFFVASPDGNFDFELWKSDGTAGGTVRVADIRPGGNGSFPAELTAVGDTLFFVADDGVHGRELWTSDGTAAGTQLVRDLRPGGAGSEPEELLAVGTLVLFAADDGVSGHELWKSDGSWGGTSLVRDIVPGSCFGSPCGSSPEEMTAVGGRVFFSAFSVRDPLGFAWDRELWQTDGTAVGTQRVEDIAPGSDRGSWPGELTDLGGLLLFRASDDTVQVNHGDELWRSDGTAAGTWMVKDIWAGSDGSFPNDLTAAGDSLYFSAHTPEQGTWGGELWVSDGTASGTRMVEDIYPGSNPINSWPEKLVAWGDAVVFRAEHPQTGEEPWTSAGWEPDTAIAADLAAGATDSDPYLFTSTERGVYFVADDAASGYELWFLPVATPLWSQTDARSPHGKSSQQFELSQSQFDAMAADDFEVPAGDDHWDVGKVTVGGVYGAGAGPAPEVAVALYADAASLPGSAVCTYPDLVAGGDFSDSSGDLAIVLPQPCRLDPGPYWVMVQVDMDFVPDGQWWWSERTRQSHAAYAWKNPGDGFGTGCTDWTRNCGNDPDLTFSISTVPGCLSWWELSVPAQVVTSRETFSACHRLIVGPDFQVAAGGDVTLDADAVDLLTGFTVERGGVLRVGG